MPRLPKLRLNYAADRGFLIRLGDAVSRDDKRASEWKQRVITLIRKLEAEFLQADQEQAELEQDT